MANYNLLVQNGTFTPATALTPQVDKYQRFKYGWSIGYNMNPFIGYTQGMPAAATFTTPNVPVATWAEEAKARGVDYAVLTILNECGFLLYESEVTPAISTIVIPPGVNSPQQPIPYQVTGSADKNIVTKFVTEFKSRGIEPLPYINIALNYNIWFDKHIVNIPDAQRKEDFIQYYCLLLQEMILKFGFKYIWVDAGPVNSSMMQRWYNAIKSVDPECCLICNNAGETNFDVQFPYDIQSCEEYSVYNGNVAYKTNARVHNGVTYYVGQEICGTPYGVNSEWYDYSDGAQQYPNPVFQRTPLEQYQSIVDISADYKRPFLAAILVSKAGVIVPDNLDYLDSITFPEPTVMIQPNVPTIVISKVNRSFALCGITPANTRIIYKIGSPSLSYNPARPLNSLDSFEAGEGYFIIMKTGFNITQFCQVAT